MAFRDHRLWLGDGPRRQRWLWAVSDRSLSPPISSKFSNISKAGSWGPSPQQRHVHRRSRLHLGAARGGRRLPKSDELALRRARQPHAQRGDRHRLRRVKDPDRAAESRTLRHGRAHVISTSAATTHPDGPGIRLPAFKLRNQGLGRSRSRTSPPTTASTTNGSSTCSPIWAASATARPGKRSARLVTIGPRRSRRRSAIASSTPMSGTSADPPRFPLPSLDVRAFRRFQVQLLGELFCAASTAVGSSLTTPRTRASRVREMRRAGARQ